MSLLGLVAVFALSNQSQAAYPYNFPTYSKVKITRDPHGQSWLYLEFMWGRELKSAKNAQELEEIKKWNDMPCHKPNFEQGKAVEFEIGIVPKCFLRPKGGMDGEFDCEEVMGFFEEGFNLPNDFIPEIGDNNCYVDVWNYWNPSVFDIVPALEEHCGDLTWQGERCAETASAGSFLDPIGNFAVGLHDASALKAGIRYSFKYPVEVVALPGDPEIDEAVLEHAQQCLSTTSTYPAATQCASDPLIMEDQFKGYYTPSNIATYLPKKIHSAGWGRAQVTMQTFNNECDLPPLCDISANTYTCPHLIGVATSSGECRNVQKETDYWLTKLCVPTDDYKFVPGVRKKKGDEDKCMNEWTSIDLDTNGECCIDLDGDGYYAHSSSELYGTQANDCNDADASINPVAAELCGDGIDNNCDGVSKDICFFAGMIGSGGVLGNPPHPCDNPACNPGETQEQPCGNGGQQISTCNYQCQWGPWGNCEGGGFCQPGTQQQCGNCGTMTCNSNGQWGLCLNQGVCSLGDMEDRSCNDVGVQTKTCNGSCAWNGWGTCSAECVPGQQDTQPCSTGGQSGTETRNCNLNGTWTSWSACVVGCQCSSGPCCDNCNYYSSSHTCDGYTVYQCQGSNPGQDAQKAVVNTYCSGNSASCDGQEVQGSWLLHENCSSSQKCEMNGGVSECVPVSTCQDVYIASGISACHTSAGTQYGYTACLEVDQVSGPTWRYRICKDSGAFTYGIKYQLADENHSTQSMGGQYQEGGGNSCTNWRNFSVNHITQYGSNNGAGLRGELITPPACTLSSCIYKTGMITIRKECQ